MKVERTRVLPAPPAEVWATVGDPSHLARWWPRVERVEQIDASGFTEVFRTKQGRTVRADFDIARRIPERELIFDQRIADTPFARVLAASRTTISLAPADGGTRVAVELEQTAAGMAKFGGFMVRGAMRKQLDTALKALADAVAAPAQRSA